jgi:hypothetical protein
LRYLFLHTTARLPAPSPILWNQSSHAQFPRPPLSRPRTGEIELP